MNIQSIEVDIVMIPPKNVTQDLDGNAKLDAVLKWVNEFNEFMQSVPADKRGVLIPQIKNSPNATS
jgi:hypothetical protein